MTKRLTIWISLVLTFLSLKVLAWDQNSHRIVGKISDNHLSIEARLVIHSLLSGDNLAEVTTWANENRFNPANFWQYKKANKGHDKKREHAKKIKSQPYRSTAYSGYLIDEYSAVLKSSSVLKSPTFTPDKKQFYLRFLIHLIGDVYQPVHVGCISDCGGNKINVSFFGNKANLYSHLDRELVESENFSYTEFVNFIDAKNPQFIAQGLTSEPQDWVLESNYLPEPIYNLGTGYFSYTYLYQHMPSMKEYLLKGGTKLVDLLNRIFDKSVNVQVNTMSFLESENKH